MIGSLFGSLAAKIAGGIALASLVTIGVLSWRLAALDEARDIAVELAGGMVAATRVAAANPGLGADRAAEQILMLGTARRDLTAAVDRCAAASRARANAFEAAEQAAREQAARFAADRVSSDRRIASLEEIARRPPGEGCTVSEEIWNALDD